MRWAHFVLVARPMTKRLPFLLALLLGCGEAATSTNKPLPTDDPLVDDIGADSLYAPTLKGQAYPGQEQYGDLTSGSRYHAFTLVLEAGQQASLHLGGVATDGSILDTVLYVYGPKDSAGKRHKLAVNDDRTFSDFGSALNFQPEPELLTDAARARLAQVPDGRWRTVWVLGADDKPWPVFVRVGGVNERSESAIQDAQSSEILEWDATLRPAPAPNDPTTYPRLVIAAPPVHKGGLFSAPRVKF